MSHYECRYCDTGFRPVSNNGDLVCSGCGAEWEGANILIEEDEDNRNEELELLSCGCYKDYGCECRDDYFELAECEEDEEDD